MRDSNNSTLYVDGQKICAVDNVSYTIDQDVTAHAIDGNRDDIWSIDAESMYIDMDMLTEQTVSIDTSSHVVVVLPPSAHDENGEYVIEVWDIHTIEQHTSLSITGDGYNIHIGVDGFSENIDDDEFTVEEYDI